MAKRIQALHLDDLIPQMYVRTPDGHFVTNSLSTSSCQSFYRPSDSHARGIASVISFDLLGDNFFWDADHVVSNWPTFYESQDRFVITESAHDSWWYYWFRDDPEQTNVHVFDSSKAGQSHYLGSGRIDASVWDPFAIDEQDGLIRIAATSGGWWHYGSQSESPVENHSSCSRRTARTTPRSVISAASPSASGSRRRGSSATRPICRRSSTPIR